MFVKECEVLYASVSVDCLSLSLCVCVCVCLQAAIGRKFAHIFLSFVFLQLEPFFPYTYVLGLYATLSVYVSLSLFICLCLSVSVCLTWLTFLMTSC